jgi:hypothetical protein
VVDTQSRGSASDDSLLADLSAELRRFDSALDQIKGSVGTLPYPLDNVPLISLRTNEELRHGSDHLVIGLKNSSEDQLREALVHFRNLTPDLYMHINGMFLRWAFDGMTKRGLFGKNRTEEKELKKLIHEYGQARMIRTPDRDRSIAISRSVFQELLKLMPVVSSAVNSAEQEQRARLDKLRFDTLTTTIAFYVGVAAVVGRILLWIL